MIRIALDAMGGDYAPQETVKGAVEACREIPLEVILVGEPSIVNKEMEIFPDNNLPISVVSASEVIRMDEPPTFAVSKKRDSSIAVAAELIKNLEADALVTAGNTGAAMVASLIKLGRIKGIIRPALAVVIPTSNGGAVLIDAGANIDCQPKHLVQFASMGNLYAQKVLKIDRPKVGLLSNGEEEGKGNELTIKTYQLLKEVDINFCGNVEGRDILKGRFDVVVCDGFVGNALLKFGEEVVNQIFSLLSPYLKRFKKKFDYQEYGGAILLGANGVVVIAHGNSNAQAIKNAIKMANDLVKSKVTDYIRQIAHVGVGFIRP